MLSENTAACKMENVPSSGATSAVQLTLSNYFNMNSTPEDPFESVFSTESSTAEPISAPPLDADSNHPHLDVPTDSDAMNRMRQRDAWLPSESTLRALSNARSSENVHHPEIKPFLSQPELESSAEGSILTDPYRALLLCHLKDAAAVDLIRRIPNPSDHSTGNIESLKELVANGWYRPALDLTRRLLTDAGFVEEQGGATLTPLTAQIWLTRLALLVRTRNYDLAERELASFQTLDAPNVYFEHAPELYPNRAGSIIPFSLRLLHAELPFHLSRSEEALNRLYYLLAIIDRIKTNLQRGYNEDGTIAKHDQEYCSSSLRLWSSRECRVLSGCLSIYLSEYDYQAAIETVHRLAIVCAADQSILRGLASVLGRIYLQMGDLETAKTYFARAVSTLEHKNSPQLSTQLLFQNALLSLGKGDYEEAKKHFQEVLSLDPTNVAAVNNMVVCSLYLGQLSGAIRVLETLLTTGLNGQVLDTSHPTPSAVLTSASVSQQDKNTTYLPVTLQRRFCLHDALVSNLAVLYEVESESATRKKVNLLERLAALPGEPVHISAFKLSAS
ncbi:unnamed protein product [Dicrocoelium dendriticum]|nr:unnamed protein product [Dicrocoelium dendriticum]